MKSWLIGKDPDSRKDSGHEEKGVTEDKMIGWHHWLNGLEFEQTLGDSEVQGSLVHCSPWHCRESDTTERLKNNKFSVCCDQHAAQRSAEWFSERVWGATTGDVLWHLRSPLYYTPELCHPYHRVRQPRPREVKTHTQPHTAIGQVLIFTSVWLKN